MCLCLCRHHISLFALAMICTVRPVGPIGIVRPCHWLLHIKSKRYALCMATEALTEWERLMNPIVKRIAIDFWGAADWFNKCISCLSKNMQENSKPNKPFDLYRIYTICMYQHRVFFPESVLGSDSLMERHRLFCKFSWLLLEHNEFDIPGIVCITSNIFGTKHPTLTSLPPQSSAWLVFSL